MFLIGASDGVYWQLSNVAISSVYGSSVKAFVIKNFTDMFVGFVLGMYVTFFGLQVIPFIICVLVTVWVGFFCLFKV